MGRYPCFNNVYNYMYLHTIKKTINISVLLLIQVHGQSSFDQLNNILLKSLYRVSKNVSSVNIDTKAWNGDQEV